LKEHCHDLAVLRNGAKVRRSQRAAELGMGRAIG
jgi:hypothetical protein